MDNIQPPDETTQALHEANEYLRAIFDSIRDYAVFTVDLDKRIATWNTGAQRVFGWTESEAIGQSGAIIFTPEDRENGAHEAELRTALEKGVAEDKRWHLRKDGSRFFANGTMRQLRDQDRNLRGFIKVTRDATVELLRQQAEEALAQSEEKYRTLFNSIDTGFCIIEVLFDTDHKPIDYRFIEVNPAFVRQTGILNALGRSMRDIAPLHEEYWFEIYGKVAITGEPIRFENIASQLQRNYDVYAFRIGEAADRRVAVLFNDISDRKRAEAEEREQRILAERLKERQKFARDLHDAVSQTLFTAGIMTETLPRVMEQNPADIPPLLGELNRLIKGAQAEMRTLLFELRPSNLESTPLNRLLRQLIDTVQGRKRMDIVLNFEGEAALPPEVHVAVYRIMQEALNNIIKHANAPSAWISGRAGVDFVELRIRDIGAGFNTNNPKAGLGLQMMRERAEEVGALVEIRSAVGSGTEVHLVYPRTEPPQL